MRRAVMPVLLATVMALLGGCGKSDAETKEQVQLAAAKSRLLAAFERQLKDPDSVKYRDVVVKLGAMSDKYGRRADAVCGHYNAKNSMGGYGGYSIFVVYQFEQDEPTVWTTEGGQPFAAIARDNAKSMGCSGS